MKHLLALLVISLPLALTIQDHGNCKPLPYDKLPETAQNLIGALG